MHRIAIHQIYVFVFFFVIAVINCFAVWRESIFKYLSEPEDLSVTEPGKD